MSKELEALKEIREKCGNEVLKMVWNKNREHIGITVNNNLDIIEAALKRLPELEKVFVSLSKEDEKTKKLLSKEIEKNRALEIIKEKKWLVEDILNAFIEDKDKHDLLKEVLL